MGPQEVLALDREHVWHPYAPMPAAQAPLVVESAAGVRLRLAEPVEGVRELVDGMSSWWSAIHGYAHPALDAAARDQLGRMSHVMFGGLTHEPAVRLAARLAEITPGALRHVFLADSGSVSVEVAAKMCLQHWRSLGRPEKRRLCTWRGGYYGDTLQPMSVCDPEGGMHHMWAGVLPEQVFVRMPPPGFEAPADPAYLDHVEAVVAEHADELAAVIVEPVVQGAGGMRFHSPEYLTALRAIADRNSVLLVFDEIATGFGRTGTMFASEHAGIEPDILCVGKALTGGYLSMAAMLCTSEVGEVVSNGPGGALMHGPTFMANPLACAVALASLELLVSQGWAAEISRIAAGLSAGLKPAADLPGVKDVRVLGAVGVVQLDHPVDVPRMTDAVLSRGVWVRPFRDLVYTMPPYICTDEDIAVIGAAITGAIAEGN